ncbi:MAG: amino acid adenylation domain-containing protein, partial [bacterium]|nr:amino acid adenylation domain-containing protein [bacterium]
AENALALPALPACGAVSLVNTVPSALRELLRLAALPPSVRAVNLAGEALPRELVEGAYQHPGVKRVLNLYGPSEDTTYSTWARLERGRGGPPPIGRPVSNTRAYVLDRRRRPVPPGVPGELFLAGAGLARCYLDRPRLTAERWLPDPFAGRARGARMYRTGDLVRALPDGELAFLGRLDHQVKVRGFRIELGEVEAVLRRCPAVLEGVVLVREEPENGERRLVAYLVPRDESQAPVPGDLRAALAETLPEHMVPAAFVALPALPLTANGKVDRRALARLTVPGESGFAAAGEYVAPRTPTEEVMAGIWSRLLGRGRIGLRDHFFELGGHSLLATRLISRVRDLFGVEPALRAVFQTPTLAALSERVERARGAGRAHPAPPIRPPAEDPQRPVDDAPLSFAQQRLWFLAQLVPDAALYNIPLALRLRGPLNRAALAAGLGEIVRRHQVLRSRFAVRDGEPYTVICPPPDRALPVVDLTRLAPTERPAEVQRLASEQARRPFDLSRGPFLRALLLHPTTAEHLLLLTMHHAASDGWSLGVLNHELSALYAAFSAAPASELPEPAIQYSDYARWQREWLRGEVWEAHLAYWRQQLAGLRDALELPADRPRPPVPSFRGAIRSAMLPETLSEALRALGRGEGTTLFMTLLAAFDALLARSTGTDEVTVGSPIANRNRSEIEELIGFFVNVLPLRVRLAGNPSFRELLARVREVALDAYAHQDLPFEKLVEELQPQRDLSRQPLFQVVFALQSAPEPPLELAGVTVTPLRVDGATAKFDLTLFMDEAGSELAGGLEYSHDLFDSATIERMLGHFRTLLAAIVRDPGRRLSELPLLTRAEHQQLLVEWNETAAVFAAEPYVHRAFEARAAAAPAATAVVSGGRVVSYGELNRRANGLAHTLSARGVGPDLPVGIFMERSPAMVVAILGVLKAGGAYLPLDPASPPERLAFMLRDAAVRVLLSEERLRGRLDEVAVPVLCLDGGDVPAGCEANPRSGVRPENPAYVIYTSGSTGRPKGTELAHAGLANLVAWHRREYRVTAADRATQLAGPGFDAAVWEVWPYLTAGAAIHIPAPEVVADPRRLLEWLAEEGITLSFLPTPLAEVVLAEPLPPGLRLRALLTGGDRLHRRPGRDLPFALVNHYGPTENTVVTTWTVVTADDRERGAPPIGRPLPNHRIYLLDAGLRPVPVGVAGELHAAGPGLARGYLGRPALTAASFIPNPCAGESERLAGERLYKTGDLARYLPDGRIGFLGRIDHQVKIRGFRIELGEIEAVLGGHPTVREAVVLVREEARAGIGGGGERRLVAYVVAEPGAGALAGDRLRAHLAEKLPESMVPAAFVELEALPLTPNGKVDRSALSRRTLPATAVSDPGREGAFAAPRTPAEELMAGIWMELLGDAPGRERIGVHDDFFALGGHSLLATQLVSRVRDLLAVELPVRSVFQAPTIAALSARAESARRAGEGLTVPPIRPLPEAAERPLSFAQQRLWFLAQLEPDAAIYNIPRALRLGGALHRAAIEAALNEVVHRHEALRTRLVGPPEGEPYQVICEPEAVFCPLPVADLNALAAGDREPELRRLAVEEARRPFDLAVGLPLRATLLGCGEAEHLFLLTIHHVAADGWSMGILHRELAALYDALSTVSPAVHGGLPELPIQYADFARWQRQWLRGRVLELQLGYWKEQLAGIHGALELPADRPRPVIPSYRGALGVLELPAGLTEALKALSRRQGSTLFMTLLAAFAALLHGTTGEDDVSVGSPIANRNRSEIEGLIGFFVNTLLLRTRLTGNPSFAELVARVREVTLGAYAHQDLPFEKLVEELQPERDLSRQPLFQVMFILQNAPGPVPELRGLTVSPLELDAGMAKFDLTLGLTETEGALTGELEYATDLYDATTAQRFLRHYRNLLESAAADPERRLDGLSTLSAAERHQLFVSWNDTGVCYPWEAGIHELFEAQVTRTPDAVAVVFGDRCWSYRELETRANRLAHHLQSLGVGPDVTVGVALERSPEVVQALFGVLKAGGVYLPLDRSYPADRLEYMLSDARAEILVTRREPLAELPPIEARPVLLDADRELIARASPERPASRVRPENLSYLVYTSGSTGRPKGVALVHRTLTNLIAWQLERRGFAPGGRTAQFSALSFDASVHEIPSTLSSGGTLFLVTEEERRDPRRLVELMATHGVERLFLPFVALQQLAEAAADKPPHALREVITAGEQLQVSRQVEHFFTLLDRCTLDNHYGPSESHVVTAFMLRGAAAGWPALPSIGRPVANFRIYLLDRRLRPVALGVPGELFLNGEGLARGYYGRPDLTAEKFVPDPFGDRTGGARMYATGDLGRFAADGTIEFLGRIDHQVKIRGFRIEPGEIETALSRHPAVREAAVLVRGDAAAGEKRLVAYVVAEGEAAPSPGELRDHLGTTLPDYMVPAIFVALETLPLLPSGKVNRRALPAPEPGVAVATGERVAPRDPVEEILTRIWSQVLGIEGVGIRDDFFALGGHSLLATQVQSRMRHELGIELPLRLLFEQPTVADLAGHVAAALRRDQGPAAPPLRPAARTGPVVLSFAQQRLWFLAWLEPEAAVYSVPEALRLRGPLRRAALEAAINAIVHRHEALRTRFVSRQGEPYQEVRPPVFRALPVVDATALAAADRELEGMRLASAEADRSFDLERGPLLRAFLVHAAEAEHVLVLNQHHVVSDAWSLEVFNRELAVLYEAFAAGESAPLFGLPELEIQYADFAIWQRQWLQGEVLEAELAFWKEQLAGAPEALELPADRPRPATQSYRGTTRSAVLDPELAAALKALSRQRGGTPFMTLLAAFEILLARFTGEQDLSVGTHIANRNRSEIEGLIGFFVNTLVLRTDLEGDPGFEEVLRRVREVSLRAYAHQDLPFEKLVEELRPERDLSRHPFFQVAFQLLNVPASPLALAGIEVSPLDVSIHVARFDVELAIMETPGELVAVIEYSTDLFDATTILRLLESYSTLLAAAVDDPQRRLSELPLLAPAAEQQLFVEWNDTGRPDPGGATIPALFEAPAVANPDITAVVAGDHRLSYRGLNRRANRLARHLRTLGVGPETLVGICLERSAEMVVAILGVLKAGGAYLPLDPEYPRERLAFMLDDAKALLVLTEERLLGVLPDDGTRVLRLDRDLERQAIAEYRGDDLVHLAGADNLAYLIYTSGSTGRAKAVAIEHRSAVAMVEWTREVFAPEEIAAVLASTSICFDLSVFELFVPLSRGGTVILAATALDLPALPAASEVTLINTVPSAMTELLRSGGVGPGVRTINLAGEPLRRALVDEIAGLGTAGRVLNLYGPSEDTTYSTSTVVPQGVSREPTIGRPVAGTRSYLVDRHLRPVPAGVVGELLLAGEGLARGYLDRPEQTASRFVPDPLSGDPRSARPGTLHLSPSGGTRTYRTGDLARFAPDGELEFLGRIDHQVKVRGFRIELGEIEAALGRHPGVRDAVVVAREDEPGDP